jgi:regulator of sigma E protease
MAAGWLDPGLWVAVLEVAIALGLVIFVHELGHFAVAKLCGVKCEKFYLGFDIAGWKLCKFRWGETEYGIGILPLGGYVKMLGQEDNPARLREEIERAKQKQADGEAAQPSPPTPTPLPSGGARGERSGMATSADAEAAPPGGCPALFDPRSYLAQSVPRRMAIISAGVVMNLVFAFVVAVIAFELGVPQRPCRVGGVTPGQAAWQQDLRIGDEILRVDGKRIEKFRDMQEAVRLSDNVQEGIPMIVQRPGRDEPLTFTVTPDSSGLLPMIGIISPWTTALQKKGLPCTPGSAAAKAVSPFELGDEIVQINDQPIESHRQLHAYLALHRDDPIKVTVRRLTGRQSDDFEPADAAKQITIDVAPNPIRGLGLVMKMGPISAVQVGSAAAEAGIKPGDKLVKIDLHPPADRRQPPNFVPPGDPLTLRERIRRRAGQWIALLLEGDERPKYVRLGPADRYEEPLEDDSPVSVPELGIAYWVLNQVDHAVEGAPNRAADVPAGAEIVGAKIVAPKEQTPSEQQLEQRSGVEVKFDEEHRNWPLVLYTIQHLLPATEVKLEWVKGEEEGTTTLQPYAVGDWPNPDRGFLFQPLEFIQQGETLGESIRLAAKETIHASLLVYRTLQKLGTGQVSPKALGGPISIFIWLKLAAEQSLPELLITLTLLSANLAVLNFLPIPLLDGGHMVFLTWEAVRGRPADERVQLVLTYVGLILILALMIWVTGLDIKLIPRH